MALHKHVDVERDFQYITELIHTALFKLAPAIGKEDEGDAVGLEVGEGFSGARERFGAAEKDAIDTV